MQLSKNFSLEEAIKSSTAIRLGIDNHPPAEVVPILANTATKILQPARDHFGIPFAPSSFYRCLELNRALRSKDTSQHVLGEAVDFEIPGIDNFTLASWVRDNLDFDQLILEHYELGSPHSGWVHCSYTNKQENRRQVLTIENNRAHNDLVK